MGYKDQVVCTRMDDEYAAKLDAITAHLRKTKPTETWTRSTTVRHMIDRFYDSLPAEAKKEEDR